MGNRSSVSSRQEKQTEVSTKTTSIDSLTDEQKAVLAKLRESQQAGESVNYGDTPPAPAGPQPPAATLRKRMILRDMSNKEMADALHVPVSSLDPILSIKGGMTADMAARLARYFGDTPQFWMDLQTHYDLAHVDQEAIAREVLPAAS
jgi:addiction module HigA family antidote